MLMVFPGYANAESNLTPDQERLTLIKALQLRLPGTQPRDWALGGVVHSPNSGGSVEAIPFDADNATNSADILAIGKKAWDRKFKNGKSPAFCFPNGGKRVAATYPQYDAKAKQVVTLEMAINRCFKLHGEPEIELTNSMAMGPLSAYARSLSDSHRLTIRVSNAAATEKFNSGKSLFARRIGQQDLACASCHVLKAGSAHREKQSLSVEGRDITMSPVVGQATSWPKLEPGSKVRTLQMQFQSCMRRVGAEPFELGSEEFNNLEYFHAFVSNGLPVKSISIHR